MYGADIVRRKSRSFRLNRSNLRDIVLLCAVLSSPLFPLTGYELFFSLALLGAGCLLHIVAKGQLIRNVTLCRKGLYGMVRHPYYLANYVIDSAICLLSGNICLVALYPFFFFWAYGPTFEKEEHYLASEHGRLFHEHVNSTPQVFPHSGSVSGGRRFLEGFCRKRVSLKEWARAARFWASALFIMFVHEVREDGLRVFYGTDTDGLVLLSMIAVLSVTSFLLLSKRSGADNSVPE
ncbi:MAG: hypothetical protein A4E64_01952 [Syntrophorhabdus sp. PtaU1.Bin058]|nr:MAG: hypothetical protein A4E64_01952 [Syntrophorhabdus sp. PtaU1.Bin058]